MTPDRAPATPSSSASPVHTQLHAWLVALDLPDDQVAGLAGLLDATELAAANRFAFEADRRRHIVAHAALRDILSRYTGIPLEALAFESGPQGKPFLAEGLSPVPPSFNLAHGGELALVGVAAAGDVGVDIELRRPIPDLDALARRVLSAAEQDQLASLCAGDRLDGFLAAWTRKEAVVKAIGVGLQLPLDAFDVRLDPSGAAELLAMRAPEGQGRWWCVAFRPDRGYHAAVAVRGAVVSGWRVVRWEGPGKPSSVDGVDMTLAAG